MQYGGRRRFSPSRQGGFGMRPLLCCRRRAMRETRRVDWDGPVASERAARCRVYGASRAREIARLQPPFRYDIAIRPHPLVLRLQRSRCSNTCGQSREQDRRCDRSDVWGPARAQMRIRVRGNDEMHDPLALEEAAYWPIPPSAPVKRTLTPFNQIKLDSSHTALDTAGVDGYLVPLKRAGADIIE